MAPVPQEPDWRLRDEAEAEHEEISADYKRIIDKLQNANTAYARQLLVSNVQIEKLKQSLEEVQASKATQSNEHASVIEQYKMEIEQFKRKHQEQERIRRSSISALHDNLLGKLLEAEADHAEIARDYQEQIGELKVVNVTVEKTMNVMAAHKVDSIKNAAISIQELRESLNALSKQYHELLLKHEELTSRSAVQHLTKSVAGLLGLA